MLTHLSLSGNIMAEELELKLHQAPKPDTSALDEMLAEWEADSKRRKIAFDAVTFTTSAEGNPLHKLKRNGMHCTVVKTTEGLYTDTKCLDLSFTEWESKKKYTAAVKLNRAMERKLGASDSKLDVCKSRPFPNETVLVAGMPTAGNKISITKHKYISHFSGRSEYVFFIDGTGERGAAVMNEEGSCVYGIVGTSSTHFQIGDVTYASLLPQLLPKWYEKW